MAGKMRWGDSAEMDDDEAEFEVALPAQQVSVLAVATTRTFVPLQAMGGKDEREPTVASGAVAGVDDRGGVTRRRIGRRRNGRTAAPADQWAKERGKIASYRCQPWLWVCGVCRAAERGGGNGARGGRAQGPWAPTSATNVRDLAAAGSPTGGVAVASLRVFGHKDRNSELQPLNHSSFPLHLCR